jgi:ABC-2 type transport system ATP-binding protein
VVAVTEAGPAETGSAGALSAVAARGVSKWFGPATALDAVDFTVRPGDVHGLLGPNGAGKTTLLALLFGLILPDEGTLRLFGRTRAEAGAGWLDGVGGFVETPRFYPYLSGRRNLAVLAGLDGGDAAGLIDAALDRVGLTGAREQKVRGYSLGMRQRLGIAAAMLGDPPIVMMDEPFNGIDPEGIIWMRGFLRSLAAEGRAILISSHLMSELEDVVDHVVVVGRGKVLADATIDELVARASNDTVTVRTDAPADAVAAIQSAGGTASVTSTDRVEVAGLQPRRVVEILSAGQVSFSEVTSQRANLEDVYLQLTAGEAEFQAHSDVRGQR